MVQNAENMLQFCKTDKFYRLYPRYTINLCIITSRCSTVNLVTCQLLYHRVMPPKDADGNAITGDPEEHSDQSALFATSIQKLRKTRIDVYETLCPQQVLVHKGGKI